MVSPRSCFEIKTWKRSKGKKLADNRSCDPQNGSTSSTNRELNSDRESLSTLYYYYSTFMMGLNPVVRITVQNVSPTKAAQFVKSSLAVCGIFLEMMDLGMKLLGNS